MLAENHRQAAEDIEKTITPLQTVPDVARVIIEGACGASFHWIAFGCQTKYQRHKETHTRLDTFLRSQGADTVAEWSEELDLIRQDGWFGENAEPERVQRAFELLQRIHNWATQ